MFSRNTKGNRNKKIVDEFYELQGLLPAPCIWVDQAEAVEGLAALRALYSLGGAIQTCILPFKYVRVESCPDESGIETERSYHAFISPRAHTKIYRILNVLFPLLNKWDKDLRDKKIPMHSSTSKEISSSKSLVGQMRAMSIDQARSFGVSEV